jgi:uncharacterized membrane protein
MKLKLRVFDVPLHPLLVHFPIAFWLVVPVLDIAALYAGPDPWWTMAQAATIFGIVIGAASIAVGLLEYLQPSLVGIDLKSGHLWHGAYSPQSPWQHRCCQLLGGQ